MSEKTRTEIDNDNLRTMFHRLKNDCALIQKVHLDTKRVYFEFNSTKFAIILNPN